MSETHIEDLTDRIRPRAASNLLLWAVVGFVVVFIVWASSPISTDRARTGRLATPAQPCPTEGVLF